MIEKDLTPKQIVDYLNKFIVGQNDAKKAVAIALRNRLRRQKLPKELQEEITPKNILMIGPTGVGKTEIARRLAKLIDAPFLKVEATKYTEVGYVGRDVESMIRDIVQISVNMVREKHMQNVREKAEAITEEKILDLLVPPLKNIRRGILTEEEEQKQREEENNFKETREKFRQMLREGKLEDKLVEVVTKGRGFPAIEVLSSGGIEEIGINIQEMMEGMAAAGRTKKKKIPVKEAREVILMEEMQKLIDMEKVVKEAIENAEKNAIIFIDEIDKIASREKTSGGPDVSREGVQRDILPIVEGTTVMTKYGPVKTDHMLFIAAGAFHVSKPSDLIPELQGRFPIRVELLSLTKEDFERILKEPENSLVKQYTKLLETDNCEIQFNDSAISEIARAAFEVNETMENIGARRLHTVIEKVLEDFLFEAPYPQKEKKKITKEYVESKIKELIKDKDLGKYIL